MTIDNNLSIVFPGQGSQSIGMSAALFEYDPEVKTCFERASEVLGYDLWKIVSEGPESDLNKTEITQPALLTASYATWLVWKKNSESVPALLAGHSLGEYTALVCAEVISLEDAVSLVAERGRNMQAAVPEGVGAMAAILGLDDADVEAVCESTSDDNGIVSAANYNSPGQIVIAGNKTAVESAIDLAKEKGAKRALLLPVSVPSHCMLMRDAADKFAEKLDQLEFKDAAIPIIQNVDAVARTTASDIRPALLEQLYKPVQWVNCINTMRENNIEKIIECGPGKVLAGLCKRIDRSMDIHFIQDQASLEKVLSS